MKQLSQVLGAMQNPDLDKTQNTPHLPQAGLTENDGRTSLACRERPLTETQLMQIHSRMLEGRPSISSEKRKKYGRKTVSDEYGEYALDDQVIGEEETAIVCLPFSKEIDERILEASLRPSPIEATVAHLSRLAVHKRLGSTKEDRAILIHDYASALKNIPEFVLYLACKYFWEDAESHFYPSIKELKSVCDGIMEEIGCRKNRKIFQVHETKNEELIAPEKTKADPIEEAEKMVKLAEENPKFLDVVFWQAELERLKSD